MHSYCLDRLTKKKCKVVQSVFTSVATTRGQGLSELLLSFYNIFLFFLEKIILKSIILTLSSLVESQYLNINVFKLEPTK